MRRNTQISPKTQSNIDSVWSLFSKTRLDNQTIFEHLTYFLLLWCEDKDSWSKLHTLTSTEEFPEDSASEIIRNSKRNIFSQEQAAYTHFLKSFDFKVQDGSISKQIINKLDKSLREAGLNSYASKGIEDIYEYLLEILIKKENERGPFITPKSIVQMMVNLAEPNLNDTICDPACGSGSFLVEAAKLLKSIEEPDDIEPLEDATILNHFDSSVFHGCDINQGILGICSTNLLFHGIKYPKLKNQNSLSKDVSEEWKDKFTLILSNPPFGMKINREEIEQDLLDKVENSNKSEILFIYLILKILKKNGRALVLVPEGFLFGTSLSHHEVRQNLVENHKLKAIIALGSGMLKPYTGINTSILLFEKTDIGCTDKVFFYSLEDENDITHLLSSWKKYEQHGSVSGEGDSEKVSIISKEEIASYDYNLSLSRYRANELLEPPEGFYAIKLGEVQEKIFSGIHLRKEQSFGNDKNHVEVALIGNRDIQFDGSINWISAKTTSLPKKELPQRKIRKHDIILQKGFSTTHINVAFVQDKPPVDAVIDNSVLAVRVEEQKVSAEDVYFFLRSERAQNILESFSGSISSIRYISPNALKSIPIFIPNQETRKLPLEEIESKLSSSITAYAVKKLEKNIIPHLKTLSEDPLEENRKEISEQLRKVISILTPPSPEEIILEQFPTPISIAYQLFRKSEFNVYEQVLRLRDLYESASHFLYNIMLADMCRNLFVYEHFTIDDKNQRKAFKGDSMAYRMGFIECILEQGNLNNGRELFFPDILKSSAPEKARELQDDFRNRLSHTRTAPESQQKETIKKLSISCRRNAYGDAVSSRISTCSNTGIVL